MENLLLTVNAPFSKALAGHLAARLGEGVAGIGVALNDAVPLVLAGLINKADAREATWVYEASAKAQQEFGGACHSLTGMLGVFGNAGALAQGEDLLAALFGPASRSLAGRVGAHAGIKPGSAAKLLGMIGAALPAQLGQYATSHHLGAGDLATVLIGLKRQVKALVPVALGGLNSQPARAARALIPHHNNQPAQAFATAARYTLAAVTAETPRWYRVRMAFASVALLASFCLGAGALGPVARGALAQPVADAAAPTKPGRAALVSAVAAAAAQATTWGQ